MRLFLSIFCVFLFFNGLTLQAQSDKKAKAAADKKIFRGDQAFDYEDYGDALKLYLEGYDQFQNDAQLNYRIGLCYQETIYRTKSLPYFIKALSVNPKIAEDLRFRLGLAYQLNHDFDKAILEFHEYASLLGAYDFRKLATDKHIQECKYGKQLIAKKRNFKIYNIGNVINSTYPEYRPVISADESIMMFTTRRSETTGAEYVKDEQYYEDVMVSYKENGKWSEPVNLGSPINTRYHEACLAISADGQKVYLYKDDKGDGNIYECKLKGDIWSKPQKMEGSINTESFEGDACISADENLFFFVSDRKGGFGGKDIYKCEKLPNGKWGDAINLGNTINTEYDEVGPFLHPDGTSFFFSSRGHATMGGFDIFKSKLVDKKWSKPVNMGYPLNTADDDLYFVLSASNERGYYASIKDGGVGEKDIYVVSRERSEETEKDAETDSEFFNPLTILKGVISDELTTVPLEAQIQVVDNEKSEVIASFTSNKKSGKYLVSLPSGKNYGIIVEKSGYLFHSENFNIQSTEGFSEVVKDIQLKKPITGSSIVLRNIFFDTDKSHLRPESKLELQRLVDLMNTNKTIAVEISGHTDNTGKMDYNYRLSEARARSVVDYLVSKKISSSRLEYKGFGQLKPIASNDTEPGKQMNRRTEFKIVSK